MLHNGQDLVKILLYHSVEPHDVEMDVMRANLVSQIHFQDICIPFNTRRNDIAMIRAVKTKKSNI